MKVLQYLCSAFLLAAMSTCFSASAQNLTRAQLTQIEEIAREIAKQSNSNKQAVLDEMIVSFNAVATGSNVRFDNVIRIKKGLPKSKIKEWLDATREEIIPKVCARNASNPAFGRGLSFTYAYKNAYGENMGSIFIDKSVCRSLRL